MTMEAKEVGLLTYRDESCAGELQFAVYCARGNASTDIPFIVTSEPTETQAGASVKQYMVMYLEAVP